MFTTSRRRPQARRLCEYLAMMNRCHLAFLIFSLRSLFIISGNPYCMLFFDPKQSIRPCAFIVSRKTSASLRVICAGYPSFARALLTSVLIISLAAVLPIGSVILAKASSAAGMSSRGGVFGGLDFSRFTFEIEFSISSHWFFGTSHQKCLPSSLHLKNARVVGLPSPPVQPSPSPFLHARKAKVFVPGILRNVIIERMASAISETPQALYAACGSFSHSRYFFGSVGGCGV